jgi:hypothetical protein
MPGAARYGLARAGSVRLLPTDYRLAGLATDCAKMQPMFFESPPKLNDVLERLGQAEVEDRRRRAG